MNKDNPIDFFPEVDAINEEIKDDPNYKGVNPVDVWLARSGTLFIRWMIVIVIFILIGAGILYYHLYKNS